MTKDTAAEATKVMRTFDDVRESKPGGAYFVRSRTSTGAWWLLDGNPLRCSCPAGRVNAEQESERLCWHGRRLLDYLNAMSEATRPAPAPVNASAFVD